MGHSFQVLPDQQRLGPTGMEWYFLSMREKDRWVLTMGGERILLYKRRYEGVRCPLWDPIRHTSPQHSDKVCYGTGWIASNANMSGPDIGGPNYGFFAPIEIVASLLQSAPDDLALTDYGQQRIYRPVRNWSLWEPLITPGDLIIRRNNERFLVTEVFPKRWKHFILHQEWNMSEVERGSLLYELPSGL
jgi:hypothetical protein